jgi:coenzyme PQQ precursor peptide PqqA
MMAFFAVARRRGPRRNALGATTRAPEETPMKTWRKPRIDEIAVGLEINAYACAQV